MDRDTSIADDAPAPASPLRGLSTRQQVGLGVAAAIVAAGIAWSIRTRGSGEFVPLSLEGPVNSATLRELEAAFRAAGLTDFRRSGDEILVPPAKLAEYASLRSSSGARTDNWAAEWERQNERLTPFSGSGAREATREIARAKLICGMLCQLPDVEQADVVWDEDEQPGWRQSPRARATVYLMPKPDRVLTLDVIRSVRLAVSGSKKNLDPADIVVMDLARQITYEGALPATIGEELLPAIRSLAELSRREIIQHIPTLMDVSVNVDLPRFLDFIAKHPEDSSAALAAAAPGLLRVSVTAPQHPDLLLQQDAPRAIRQQIMSLTGIGEQAAEQVEVRIAQQSSPLPPPVVSPQLTGGFTPDERRFLIVSAGVLLAFAALLCWRLCRRRQYLAATPLPPLHEVHRLSQQFAAPPRLDDFDDLAQLSAAMLRSLYPQATPRRWAVALRGSTTHLREQIAAALDLHDAADLRLQCDQLGPVKIGDIDSSRQRILDSLRAHHAPDA